jgi:hypothetical protein
MLDVVYAREPDGEDVEKVGFVGGEGLAGEDFEEVAEVVAAKNVSEEGSGWSERCDTRRGIQKDRMTGFSCGLGQQDKDPIGARNKACEGSDLGSEAINGWI